MNKKKIVFGVLSLFSLFSCFAAAPHTVLKSVKGRRGTPVFVRPLYLTAPQAADVGRVYEVAEKDNAAGPRLVLGVIEQFLLNHGCTKMVMAKSTNEQGFVPLGDVDHLEVFKNKVGEVSPEAIDKSKFAFSNLIEFKREFYSLVFPQSQTRDEQRRAANSPS